MTGAATTATLATGTVVTAGAAAPRVLGLVTDLSADGQKINKMAAEQAASA